MCCRSREGAWGHGTLLLWSPISVTIAFNPSLVNTCSGPWPCTVNCFLQAFGLPVTVAHVDGQTHMLFGSDRMELLAYLLGKFKFPLSAAFHPSPTSFISVDQMEGFRAKNALGTSNKEALDSQCCSRSNGVGGSVLPMERKKPFDFLENPCGPTSSANTPENSV